MAAIVDIAIDVATDLAEAGLDRLNSVFRNNFGTMGKAAKTLGVGLAAVAVGVTAVGAAFVVTAQKALALEAKMAEIGTLIDDSFAPVSKLTEETKRLAAAFGGMPTEQAAALYETISAGARDAKAAQDLLTTANKLAVGSLTEVNTTVDALTSVLNAYSLEYSHAAKVSDAFFVAVKLGKTTVDQLSASVGRGVPLANAAGIAYEEFLAAVAALTAGGIQTSEAVTALNAIITNVTKPTAEATEEAERLGITFNSTALRSQGLKGFLDSITGSANFSKTSFEKLFGSVNGLAGALSLTKNEGQFFQSVLDSMANRAGATDAAFSEISATLGFQIKRFHALKEVALITLGETVTESKVAKVNIQAVNTILQDLIAFFKSTDGKQAVNDFFETLNTNARVSIALLNTAVKFTGALVGGKAFEEADKVFMKMLVRLEQARTGFVGVSDDIAIEVAKANAALLVELSNLKANIDFDLAETGSVNAQDLVEVQRLQALIEENRLFAQRQGETKTSILAAEQEHVARMLDVGDAFGKEKDKQQQDEVEKNEKQIRQLAAARRRKEREQSEANQTELDIAKAFSRLNEQIREEEKAAVERDFQSAIRDHDRRIELKDRELQALIAIDEQARQQQEQAQQDLANLAAAGITSFFDNFITGIVSGEQNALGALRSFGASVLGLFGSYLMLLGAAAVAGGILGSTVSIFGAILGGGAAIAAGAGLIAAGAALKGAAALVQGSPSGGGGSRAPSRGVSNGGGSSRRDNFDDRTTSRGFVPNTTSGGNTTITNHFNLSGMLAVATPAALGRQLNSAIGEANRLSSRRVTLGGGIPPITRGG